MKNFQFITLIISLLIFIQTNSFGQMPDPVKWSTRVESVKKGQAILVMTAEIEKGWHLYSQFLPDGGPIKTTFTFTPSNGYSTDGAIAEDKAVEFYDKNFEMQLKYFSGKAEFRQPIKLTTESAFTIAGNVEYMVCDDLKCLPPKVVDLTFNVKL